MRFSRLLKLASVSIFLALGLFVSLGMKAPAWTVAQASTFNRITSIHATIPATLTFAATKDNTIFEATDNSGGASEEVLAGKTVHEGVRRALFAFDLSQVATNTELISVTLRLQVEQVKSSTGLSFTLHKVTSDWGEAGSSATQGQGAPAQSGDATWSYAFYTTTHWSAAGGDFVATASATTTVGGTGSYEWSSPQLLSDVESWLANPTSSFGWILLGDETSPGSAKHFVSREGAPADERPQLILTYAQTVTETPSVPIYLPLVQR